jgi:hypothetical protein
MTLRSTQLTSRLRTWTLVGGFDRSPFLGPPRVRVGGYESLER